MFQYFPPEDPQLNLLFITPTPITVSFLSERQNKWPPEQIKASSTLLIGKLNDSD